MRERRMKELERLQRKRDFEEKVLEQHTAEVAKTKEEEAEMQKVLMTMEEQRSKDRAMELELLFKEQEVKERTAFQRALRAAETRVIEEERNKFNAMRDDLLKTTVETEASAVESHDKRMAEMIVERERALYTQKNELTAKAQLEAAKATAAATANTASSSSANLISGSSSDEPGDLTRRA